MAATTLAAILTRIGTVCEASPVTLTPTKEPFSHDTAPNLIVDQAYRVQDDGLVSSRSVGGHQAVRVDRVLVYVARKLAFQAAASIDALEDVLVQIERAIIADGPAGGYHVELAGRKITRRPESDVVIGSVAVTVDYDYSET